MPKNQLVKPKYRIRVFKGNTKPGTRQVWRWHLQSLVGVRKIVCTSGEAFYSRANALRAARRMRAMLKIATQFVYETDSKNAPGVEPYEAISRI